MPEQNIKVTVDAVIFRRNKDESQMELLLVERKNNPYSGKWALPGGFVEENEDLKTAAARELREETGLKISDLRQVQAFGKPGRDPRGPTVTVAFMGWADPDSEVSGSSDAISARWFGINNLPDLAFDHDSIVSKAVQAILV